LLIKDEYAKSYLAKLIIGTASCLLIVGLINYVIDPVGLYIVSKDLNNSPVVYVAALTKSKYGLVRPPSRYKERERKRSLARYAENVDCAIIGSSHIMQISSFRTNKSLVNICKDKLINLGVSGGTLEDFLALSFEIIRNKKGPKTIVFGISPWSLDFQRDAGWQEYSDSYKKMTQILKMSQLEILFNIVSVKWKLITNLSNFDYFLRSIEKIVNSKNILGINDVLITESLKNSPFFDFPNKRILDEQLFEEAPVYDSNCNGTPCGSEKYIILPDGSLFYARDAFINSKIPVGGSGYKIKKTGIQYSEKAIDMFEKLLRKLNELGFKVVLLMTPYHHNVLKGKITLSAFNEIEPQIKKLGHKLGVRVLGSYDPNKIGCNPSEFFDEMHPKDVCLSKIVN
jgi:hypothetical protein